MKSHWDSPSGDHAQCVRAKQSIFRSGPNLSATHLTNRPTLPFLALCSTVSSCVRCAGSAFSVVQEQTKSLWGNTDWRFSSHLPTCWSDMTFSRENYVAFFHSQCVKGGMSNGLAGGADAVILGWEHTFINHSVWKSTLHAGVNPFLAQKAADVKNWRAAATPVWRLKSPQHIRFSRTNGLVLLVLEQDLFSKEVWVFVAQRGHRALSRLPRPAARGFSRFVSETDFVFNSNRWKTSVRPEPYHFSPRYTPSRPDY